MLKRLVRRPVQEIAPWATMVTPELVLDKDGSLLTCFTFEGVDADSPNADDISSVRTNLDNACKNFDNRITAWWRLSHRRVQGEIDGTFSADIDAYVDRINRNHVGSGRFFRNSHSLSLAYTPETGMNKIFEKVAYHMTVGGKSMLPALVETVSHTIDEERAHADTASPAWRQRCEVAQIAKYSDPDRRVFLSHIAERRGEAAAHELERSAGELRTTAIFFLTRTLS